MKVLIGILVVVVVLAILVVVGRRIEKKERLEAERKVDQLRRPHRPTLLSKAQRKARNFKDLPSPPKVTRAIRTGWSLGRIEFSYVDADGEKTQRTVTVHSVTRVYFKGECHTRREERTFRLDRVVGDLVDCDTGEVLSPKEWARRNSRSRN